MAAEPSVLTITDLALEAIQGVVNQQKVPENYYLRVGMRGGGCGGMGYILGFDEKRENDLVYEVSGLTVLIDRAHSMYVIGMEIDWHQDENQQGFVFNNPQAASQEE